MVRTIEVSTAEQRIYNFELGKIAVAVRNKLRVNDLGGKYRGEEALKVILNRVANNKDQVNYYVENQEYLKDEYSIDENVYSFILSAINEPDYIKYEKDLEELARGNF